VPSGSHTLIVTATSATGTSSASTSWTVS
jgi:hypothetical protein